MNWLLINLIALVSTPHHFMRKQGVEDYLQKLLSHEGWSGDSATGHRGLPVKERQKNQHEFMRK